MSNQVIIYPNEDGGIAVVHPAPECGLSIEEIVAKDVPSGSPYIIMNAEDLPADRYFRSAWTADFTNAPTNQ
jgi:hypothetical protein